MTEAKKAQKRKDEPTTATEKALAELHRAQRAHIEELAQPFKGRPVAAIAKDIIEVEGAIRIVLEQLDK